MITLTSGCDYFVVFGDGIAVEFKFLDNQGGIRIEAPPGSRNIAYLDQLLLKHGTWRSLTFLRCPPTP